VLLSDIEAMAQQIAGADTDPETQELAAWTVTNGGPFQGANLPSGLLIRFGTNAITSGGGNDRIVRRTDWTLGRTGRQQRVRSCHGELAISRWSACLMPAACFGKMKPNWEGSISSIQTHWQSKET